MGNDRSSGDELEHRLGTSYSPEIIMNTLMKDLYRTHYHIYKETQYYTRTKNYMHFTVSMSLARTVRSASRKTSISVLQVTGCLP